MAGGVGWRPHSPGVADSGVLALHLAGASLSPNWLSAEEFFRRYVDLEVVR